MFKDYIDQIGDFDKIDVEKEDYSIKESFSPNYEFNPNIDAHKPKTEKLITKQSYGGYAPQIGDLAPSG